MHATSAHLEPAAFNKMLQLIKSAMSGGQIGFFYVNTALGRELNELLN